MGNDQGRLQPAGSPLAPDGRGVAAPMAAEVAAWLATWPERRLSDILKTL